VKLQFPNVLCLGRTAHDLSVEEWSRRLGECSEGIAVIMYMIQLLLHLLEPVVSLVIKTGRNGLFGHAGTDGYISINNS